MFKDILLGDKYRLIAISDIHGNLQSLERVLKEADFNEKNDILIIVCDILEKGSEILGALRYVMNLVKTTNTHVVLGNCDTVLMDIFKNEIHDEIKEYIFWMKKNVLLEMCHEIDFEVSKDMDMLDLYKKLNENFKEEIAFINNLPIAMETEEFIFAHAGVEPRENYRNSKYEYVIAHDRFYEEEYKFPKKVIVGHWPVALYFQDRFDLNPIIDNDKNIFCIDGANSVAPYGQLNALILEKDDDLKISYVCVDDLKEVEVVKDQQGTKGIKIIFPYNKFKMISEDDQYVKGRLKAYSKSGFIPEGLENLVVSIPKNLIYEKDGKIYSHEFMNEFLDLKKGDKVKVAFDSGDDVLICKFKGKIALARREILQI